MKIAKNLTWKKPYWNSFEGLIQTIISRKNVIFKFFSKKLPKCSLLFMKNTHAVLNPHLQKLNKMKKKPRIKTLNRVIQVTQIKRVKTSKKKRLRIKRRVMIFRQKMTDFFSMQDQSNLYFGFSFKGSILVFHHYKMAFSASNLD